MRRSLAVLFLFAAAVFGQQNTAIVSGRVVQGETAEAQAIVHLESLKDAKAKFTVTADVNGIFKFENIPAGEYQISSSGKADSRRAVGVSAVDEFQLRAGDERTVILRLEGPPIREIVTVSAGEEQYIEEVAKSVNTIGGREMRERADFSLVESLRTIPGFRIQQLGGFGRTASIKTRGLRNQDTAILLDGIRFRDPSAITGDASPFLSDITLTSVSEVEVLRGSGSSLYGTNAIGGTVDFRTPGTSSGTHGQLSGAFGGLRLSRYRGNISHGDPAGKYGYGAALSRTDYRKGIDGDDDAGNTNLQAFINLNPYYANTYSGRIFFSDAKLDLNANPDTFGSLPPSNQSIIRARPGVNFRPDENDPDSRQESRFFVGQFSALHYIGNKLTLRGYYQGMVSRRLNDNGALGPGFQSPSISIFDGTIQTGNATLNWEQRVGHDLKVGYEFEYERFGNEGATPDGAGDFSTRAGQFSNTIFLQDLLSLDEGRLQLAGGIRAQFFSLGDPQFSLANAPYSNLALEDPPPAYTLDGAIAYFFRSSGTKLRAHVGNGYRVPSLYERFGTFFSTFVTPTFIALGDPNLKPEKTLAFDAGIEQFLANEKVKLEAVFFYTKLIDTVGFGNVVPDIGTTPRPFGGYQNQKGGISRGAEFSGTFRPTTSTDVFASSTFTNSDQLVPQVAGTGVVETLGIPKHQFTLTATQRIKRFWVNADVLVSSDYLAPIFSNSTFNTYLYRFAGNRRVDLTAGHTFPINKERFNLRVFGTIENLFDQKYFENGFRTVPRNARIGVSFGF